MHVLFIFLRFIVIDGILYPYRNVACQDACVKSPRRSEQTEKKAVRKSHAGQRSSSGKIVSFGAFRSTIKSKCVHVYIIIGLLSNCFTPGFWLFVVY